MSSTFRCMQFQYTEHSHELTRVCALLPSQKACYTSEVQATSCRAARRYIYLPSSHFAPQGHNYNRHDCLQPTRVTILRPRNYSMPMRFFSKWWLCTRVSLALLDLVKNISIDNADLNTHTVQDINVNRFYRCITRLSSLFSLSLCRRTLVPVYLYCYQIPKQSSKVPLPPVDYCLEIVPSVHMEQSGIGTSQASLI